MSHKRFFDMLDKAPELAHLWDHEDKSLHVELFEQTLGTMSHGKALMARFYSAVWFGNDRRYPFDVVDAVTVLDPEFRQIIIDWIADPFWP